MTVALYVRLGNFPRLPLWALNIAIPSSYWFLETKFHIACRLAKIFLRNKPGLRGSVMSLRRSDGDVQSLSLSDLS